MNPTEIILITALIILFFIFLFIKMNRRKTKYKYFPDEWKDYLNKKVQYYNSLSDDDKQRFENDILTFLNKVRINGVDTGVNDIDRLLVASSAVIPIFGFPEWKTYPNLDEVLLYPDTFNEESFETVGKQRDVLGMVGTGFMNREMILSKPALHRSFEQSGRNNVGIHEFVHLLDKLDGSTDGIPKYLLERKYLLPWIKLMHSEMQRIRAEHSDINPYGAVSEQEFLAVASEYFFQNPEKFKHHHPELFNMLENIFNQYPEKT